MFPYLPHTPEEIGSMLDSLGLPDLESLFSDIPGDLKLKAPLRLHDGLAEYDILREGRRLAGMNRSDYVSFMGCGSYDHVIPQTVSHVLSRSEFYTAYTPYQAEIAQGMLQSIFEFQTMICELTALDVSNASLYDGATAAVEAAVMAVNASPGGGDTILYSKTLHPFTREVLRTHFANSRVKLGEVGERDGVTDREDLLRRLGPGTAGVICQSPNWYGCLEDYEGLAEVIHEKGALFIISSNPMSLGLLKPQGEWGADIGIGDTQPLGLPRSFGGPSVGYIAARENLLRKMPGRIVGQSLDVDGKRAFLLTLQAREQHIKRQRATSNICSNQALFALATSVYLATMGREGLREVCGINMDNARYLRDLLSRVPGVRQAYDSPFFNEFVVKLPANAEAACTRVRERGILAGVPLRRVDPEAEPDLLLVAATEKRTAAEMDRFAEVLGEALR